jgi:flagellar biosynthesis GTPase FlhF
MVMEFLEGEALNDRIANSGQIPQQKTASIMIDMLEGLKAAHAAGIIHRDLKPDNVFLISNKKGKKDFVKIVDFGISKFSALGGEFSMTRTGAVMGTPYYLSPEQAKGDRDLDHRADLYAVGVILYEAAAGKVPFDGETFNELLFKIVLEPIPPLSQHVPDVDPHFAAIVEKSMARDPNVRYQTAEEMQAALQGWLDGQPAAPELMDEAREAREAGKAHTVMGTQAAGTPMPGINRTHGAWANTNSDGTPESGPNKKLIIGAAAAVLVAAGLGFAMTNMNQAEDAREAAAAQAAEDAAREAEERRESELARLEAEKAKAEAERAKADAARSEAEQATIEAKLGAEEQRRKLAEDKRKEEEEAARRAAVVRRPAPGPKPATARAPAGRRIRTDL